LLIISNNHVINNPQLLTINTIAFAPNGGWVILDGVNGYSTSNNFPPDALSKLTTLNKQGATINTIAFTPNGEWVIVYNGYEYYNSSTFPPDALSKLATINQQKLPINSIAFAPNGGWVIIYNKGKNTYYSTNIPQTLQDEITNLSKQGTFSLINVAFTSNDGFVVLYQDQITTDTTKVINSYVPAGEINAINTLGGL